MLPCQEDQTPLPVSALQQHATLGQSRWQPTEPLRLSSPAEPEAQAQDWWSVLERPARHNTLCSTRTEFCQRVHPTHTCVCVCCIPGTCYAVTTSGHFHKLKPITTAHNGSDVVTFAWPSPSHSQQVSFLLVHTPIDCVLGNEGHTHATHIFDIVSQSVSVAH